MSIDENEIKHEENPGSTQGISSRNLLFLSLTSAAVYLLSALLTFHFFHEGFIGNAFEHGFSIGGQLIVGLTAGCLAAGMIMFISDRPPVSKVLRDFYIVREISRSRFSVFDRIQLSLFAGAGEELLFRGAIQPLLGIWLTSVIFVALHGYFKFRKPGHIVFGGMMFGLSILLGVLFDYAGLLAAMSAHAVYDILMLWWAQEKD